MDMAELIPVDSSMIEALGYDVATQTLTVAYNSGAVWEYEDVPPEIYQGLHDAESKGRYLRGYILGAFPESQVSRNRRRR